MKSPAGSGLLPPPEERATPRLGAQQGVVHLCDGDLGNAPHHTLLTGHRKQQLVAVATSNPDERLYDVVGARTHQNLQVAADQNARRLWADAVAAQQRVPRVSRPSSAPDNRWVPLALFLGGVVSIALGLWLWQQKAQRVVARQGEQQVTIRALATETSSPSVLSASPSAHRLEP